eukprot:jgi/Botrbrau1/1817/Bobra.146_1s0015.1
MLVQGRAGAVWSPEAAVEPEQPEPDDAVNEEARVETDPTGRYSRFEQILGRGAFKTVYKGFDEDEGIEIAWNQVRVSELVRSKEERDRLFAEIRVLKQLKHRNIMTFHDSWYDAKSHCVNFITELFTSGTLRQYRKKHKHVDSEVLKRWAWQILCGLVYLHGHTPPIIHRDLKCDNIFINGSEGVVKIGDLGLATLLRARTAPQSVLGTPEFMAPELYEEMYDDRVDVYSFGMCLLELATLQYPYSECRNAAQIYRKVMQGTPPAGLGSVSCPELCNFIKECIAPRGKRPKSRHLLKHPYFESIRQEKAALKLHVETVAAAPICELAEAPSGLSSNSRQSSGMPEWVSDAHGQLVVVPEEAEVFSGDDFSLHRSSPPPSIPVSEAGDYQYQNGTFEDMPASTQHSGQLSDVSSEDGHQSDEDGGVIVTGTYTYSVKGKVDPGDASKLLLKLKIKPTGSGDRCQSVEFDYYNGKDTAVDLAREMVEDLNLTPEDAQAIVRAIAFEVARVKGVSHADCSSLPASEAAPVSVAAVDTEMAGAGDPGSNTAAVRDLADSDGGGNRMSPDSSGSALTKDSQDQDIDMTNFYQTRKRSSSGVLSPVNQSDGKLPLKKLFENLEETEVASTVYHNLGRSAGSDLLGTAESSELPPGPMLLGNTPPGPNQLWTCSRACTSSSSLTDAVEIEYTQSAGDLLTMANGSCAVLQGGGTQPRSHSLSLDEEAGRHIRGVRLESACASAPGSRMLSRDASPLRGSLLGAENLCVGRVTGQSVSNLRSKSKCTTAEERELRQKAAADKLLKLESNCLLDFEVKGFGKGPSARLPPPAAPLRSRKSEGL